MAFKRYFANIGSHGATVGGTRHKVNTATAEKQGVGKRLVTGRDPCQRKTGHRCLLYKPWGIQRGA
jgi:hypothetical protein